VADVSFRIPETPFMKEFLALPSASLFTVCCVILCFEVVAVGIGDAMKGDPLLFACEDAIEEEWRIVAPILASAEVPIGFQPDMWGSTDADRLIEGSGGWHE
jgi:hypothetical protein